MRCSLFLFPLPLWERAREREDRRMELNATNPLFPYPSPTEGEGSRTTLAC